MIMETARAETDIDDAATGRAHHVFESPRMISHDEPDATPPMTTGKAARDAQTDVRTLGSGPGENIPIVELQYGVGVERKSSRGA